MKNLLDITDLTKEDIHNIWKDVSSGSEKKLVGNIAWSFEGNGIRTRTTFLQAFQQLGLNYVELPNFLKTNESVQGLAGYMDSFYSMYIIRDGDHQRMLEFSKASTKPVVNAMSSEAHPCEVLTDAYFLNEQFGSIENLKILLWGPATNVFKSWHSLSEVLALDITHFCPTDNYQKDSNITFTDELDGKFDIVITDAWPADFNESKYSLSKDMLLKIGKPMLLPTPPVTVGNELLFEPSN